MSNPRKISVKTSVLNGKISEHRQIVNDAIQSFEGKQIKVTVERFYKKRTNKQNRYYWGVIIEHWMNIIKTEWGEIWSSDTMHEFLKTNLNYEEYVDTETGEIFFNKQTGRPITRPKSTTENTTVDQENYQEACRQLAYSMFNYTIPVPEIDVEVKHE
ncbi:hypothetical protein [Tenacibaculum sp. C7A-26P2]|uniref:hypothetical protein n=1 Tax=Tenacibaculum sp. C7A-26P2 TaxID=3447504 RepID=UPI003F841505